MKIDNEIKQIAAELLSDFHKKRDVAKQPVKSVIIDIIDKLQHLLFLGIIEISGGSAKNKLNVMLEEVSHDLAAQIRLALSYDLRYKDTEQDEIDKTAWDITRQFILNILTIKDFLEKDIEVAYNGNPTAYSKAEIVISYPGIYAIMVYRIAHELYMLSVPLIPRIMSEYARSVTGIDIHPGAAIGKYFFIDRGTGIVIRETAVIGDNVKFSGSTILSGDTIIGEGVIIGGNAFVIRSVPENTRVSVKVPN